MASVELKNVSKVYDKKVTAVEKATINIDDGEFAVLVGPSGCGKSTLLRMIAGLEHISAGEIKIGSRIVNEIPSKDRNIAMVFQNYALYPHMTVYENMAFGLKLRKYKKDEIERRVREASEVLDLDDFLKRKPKQLSGGQRQRVAVGRAIVRKPDVFLFDEPLSNLDAKLRVQMRLEISKLHQKLGSTMIYVTHDQVEAMTMADRIVVMNKGQIQQIDTPLDTYNSPANKFVAGFIGSPAMNFIEGTIKGSDELSFQTNGLSFQLKNHDNNNASLKAGNVSLGFRPEHVKLFTQDSPQGIKISAQIEVVEPMGNELFVYLIAGHSRLTMRCNPDQNLEAGKDIALWIDLKDCKFFSGQDGKII